MRQSKIHFASRDGTRLCGILVTLDKAERVGAVLAHGITVEKNEDGFYTRLAKVLAEARVPSLRFDFRGHGESDGEPSEMTIKGEIEDLAAAIDHVQELGWKRVAIVGTSFGGGVAVLYAYHHPDKVSCLSLLSPVLDYGRTFLNPETEWAQEWFTHEALRRAKTTGVLDLDGFPLGAKLLDEFKELNPGTTLLNLAVPALIIHGSDDSMVPFQVAKAVGSRYAHGRFISIQGADHGFEGYEECVFEEVRKWVVDHLGV